MSKNWQKLKLGEVCEFKYGEGLPERKRINGEFPVYGSGGIVDYHNKYLVEGPGIIVGRKGNIGSVYFERRNFFPIDTVFYIVDEKDSYNIRFIYYVLSNLRLDRLNTDAAVPGLNRNAAYQQYILLPPLPTQRKIASILSAYDDLIENNNRRIKILEAMAQTIYNEWFVKFRFPGYEKVKMVDSELGKIPEGWEVKSITGTNLWQLISENIRPYDGIKEYFATADVDGINIINKGVFVSFDKKPSRAQKEPVVYSVWFARMRDTYKILGFTIANKNIAENSILSSGFAGFKTNSETFPFLYFTINSKRFHELKDKFCSGATQMSLTNEGLAKINIILPDVSLIRRYGEIVSSMVDNIFLLQQKNKVLSQTRDLLLPKLISGEIDVEHLDIKTEGVE